jgi:hypothetical protein
MADAEISLLFIENDEMDAVLEEVDRIGLRRRKSVDAPPLGLDPVTVVVVTGSVVFVARFILSVWERFRGGVRIDLATHPPTVERLRAIPYGVLVILTEEKEVRIETHDEPEEAVERILTSILSLPADATAELVATAVGGSRSS